MGKIRRSLIGSAAFALLACMPPVLTACNTAPPDKNAGAITFIIVRHAEKATDDAKDPSLSEAGRERAQNLARLLSQAPLAAAYATGYKRTQQTAQPAADAHGIAVTVYDAQLPAMVFSSQLRAAHTHGTVLVVGHSNSVPDIVAALSGVAVEPMPDNQFERIYRVTVGSEGKPVLIQDRY